VIKVSVLYPNTAGCKFDMKYYLTRHMPMVQQKLGPACRRMAVEEGIAGGAPGAPATFVAMGHLYFDSIDAFQAASLRTRSRSLPTSPTTPTVNPPFRLVKLGCSVGLAPRSNVGSRNAFGTTAARLTCQWHQARDAKTIPIQEAVSSTLQAC
jgi:uncharacterized protein (TIGR02118 family)